MSTMLCRTHGANLLSIGSEDLILRRIHPILYSCGQNAEGFCKRLLLNRSGICL